MKKKTTSLKKVSVIAVAVIFILALVYTVTFDIEITASEDMKDITSDVIPQ